MRQPDANRTGPHVAAQVASSWASLDAASRSADLANALSSQDRAFLAAMREMQVVRDFVGTPENILGSATTKHGEIGEQVNVAIIRAGDVLLGRAPTATFEGVDRFAPTDYRVGGVDIQSKYYNGLRNTLDGVLGHTSNHPGFASGGGGYHIPRDQYDQIRQLHQTGRIDGLSDRSTDAIRDRLGSLQQHTGRPADELIAPGETDYREVQQGRIHDTIRDREGRLAEQNDDLKRRAQADYGPSLAGLGQAAAIGATVGGGVGLAQGVWVKYREGKNPFRGDFSARDWLDIGVPAAQGAGGGAVAGGALYWLTNATHLSAPAAGAFVSGLMGIGSLLRHYHSGQIDGEQFVDMSQIVVMDAAIVGMFSGAGMSAGVAAGSLIGQTAIPVPLLGALLGSIAGKFVASAIKDSLGESESELSEQLHAYEEGALSQLDQAYQAHVQRLDAYFGNLERLADVAFDNTLNTDLRLYASVGFAEAVGVPDRLILHTTDELDRFLEE